MLNSDSEGSDMEMLLGLEVSDRLIAKAILGAVVVVIGREWTSSLILGKRPPLVSNNGLEKL